MYRFRVFFVTTAITSLFFITCSEEENHPVFTADVFGFDWASRTQWEIHAGTYLFDDSYWVVHASQHHPSTHVINMAYLILIKKNLVTETDVPVELSFDDCDYRLLQWANFDARNAYLAKLNYDPAGQITQIKDGKISGYFQGGTGFSVDGPTRLEIKELSLDAGPIVNNCLHVANICLK